MSKKVMNQPHERKTKMSRPKFLDCVMTPEIISRIRENQDFYDKDPEGYERRERQREEERQREQEEENRQREEN